jgi:hypothetical protein
MTDLAVRTIYKTKARAGRNAYKIADGVTVYEGMLCSLEGGYLNHWADGANDVFLGILLGGDSRLGDGVIIGETSDPNPPHGFVDDSGGVLMHITVAGSPDATKVGDLVYSEFSNVSDITLNASGRTHPIGWMSAYRSSTDQDVTLFTPSEMLAQATA